MKLKTLEIQGFKSFDDKTVLNFDNSITGVVGPNGCGKSNIVDSIRWVMGEQSAKHLRGRNMEDIIFAGTQSRSPNSLASVELTFISDGVNCAPQYAGCQEISIGRKLFRSGESEYYINKQPVRLKDVTDFFLGTGVGTKAYSIIEQGRVGLVVTAKPEDRRGIIEEAAGISKFKTRKEAALRRMEATRLNLSRLHDILSEIERQRGSLERQAKKAEKFKIIRDELMQLDLGLAARTFQKLDEQQVEIYAKLKDLGVREQDLQLQVGENETWVEEERLKLLEVETELNDLQQAVFEAENSLKMAESQLANKRQDIERQSIELTNIDQQLVELKQELMGSKNGLSQINEKLILTELDSVMLEESVAEQETQLSELTENSQQLFSTLEAARTQHNEAGNKLTQIATRRETFTERRLELQFKRDGEQTELEDLTVKHSNLEKLLKETRLDLSTIKQMKIELGEKTGCLSESLFSEEQLIKEEQSGLSKLKEELLQKKSRLESLEELERNFEGYQQGPRQILKNHNEGTLPGILGSVADIVETQPCYENAVTAVLGERIQCVVVRSQEEGLQCAEYLKSAQAGRSSFLSLSLTEDFVGGGSFAGVERVVPVTTDAMGVNVFTENYLKNNGLIEHAEMTANSAPVSDETQMASRLASNGFQGYLRQFISLKPGYENLNRLLFGDVLLVDTLKNAFDVWTETRRPIVTFDGELISKEGMLTGGTVENASLALLEKKREIKELTQKVQSLVDQIKSKEEICFDLNRKIQLLKSELEEVKSTSHSEDLRLAEQEKDMLHFSRELETINAQRGKLAQQIYQADESLEEITRQLHQLDSDELTQNEILEEAGLLLEEKKLTEENCRLELASRNEELTKEKIKFAQTMEQKTFLAREVERLVAEGLRLKNEISELEAQKVMLIKKQIFTEERVQFVEKNIGRLLVKKTEVDAHYHELKNQFETLNATIQERDHVLKEQRREYSQVKDDLNQSMVKITEVRAQLSRVSEQTLERYQIVLSDVYREHLPDLSTYDVAGSEEKASELRQKLGNIGSVNIAAIDELNEINERFEFLTKQRDDLEKSLSALEQAIHKINRTTRDRFKETFDLVNEKFTKLFPRLFHGGHAYLQMTDPENILETGIDIIAQPPGKKLQSISLLSGGEKALTAVSLLFAIFLIKPAPFCLLDEVDAPLDDANVDRYNDIIKEMSQRTQFIVITHNKRTMQVTDCLFGVTMQEPGVSQIVSVQLD